MKLFVHAVVVTALNLSIMLHGDSIRSAADVVSKEGLPYLFYDESATIQHVPTPPPLPIVEEVAPLLPFVDDDDDDETKNASTTVDDTTTENQDTSEAEEMEKTTIEEIAHVWNTLFAAVAQHEIYKQSVEPVVHGLQEWVPSSWITWNNPLANVTTSSDDSPVSHFSKMNAIVAAHFERHSLRHKDNNKKTFQDVAAASASARNDATMEEAPTNATATATTWSSSPLSLWKSLNNAFGNFTVSVATTQENAEPSSSSDRSACQTVSDTIANTVHAAIDHGVKPFAFWTINTSVSSVATILRSTPLIRRIQTNTDTNSTTLSDACANVEPLLKARVDRCLEGIKTATTTMAGYSSAVCESTQATFFETIPNLATATVRTTHHALEQSATFAMDSAAATAHSAQLSVQYSTALVARSAQNTVSLAHNTVTYSTTLMCDAAVASRQWTINAASAIQSFFFKSNNKKRCTGKRPAHWDTLVELGSWMTLAPELQGDDADFGFLCDEPEDDLETFLSQLNNDTVAEILPSEVINHSKNSTALVVIKNPSRDDKEALYFVTFALALAFLNCIRNESIKLENEEKELKEEKAERERAAYEAELRRIRAPTVVFEVNNGIHKQDLVTQEFCEKELTEDFHFAVPHENRPTFAQDGKTFHSRIGVKSDGRRYFACGFDVEALRYAADTQWRKRARLHHLQISHDYLMKKFQAEKMRSFGDDLKRGAKMGFYIYLWEDRTLLAIEAKNPQDELIVCPTRDISSADFESDE